MDFTPEDRDALVRAVYLLENPSFASKLANTVGQPFEKLVNFLPPEVAGPVHDAVSSAIRKAADIAANSLDPSSTKRPSTRRMKALAAATGGLGGFFGLPALAIELPVTTTIMLRSIAEIARSEGEDLEDPGVRLACLEVFALGGPSTSDDAAETGYYAVRTLLARAVSEAASYIAERGAAEEGAPVLVRLISVVASRFGAAVSDRMLASAVPIIGAAGGASVNLIFIDHFQRMARGHFTVRRLERAYGSDTVREEYERIRPEQAA
jgi:hypothetical protein